MITVSVLAVHGELLMVQIKLLAPFPKPVTELPGEEGVARAPVPLYKVHKPVPIEGVFPERVALFEQMD